MPKGTLASVVVAGAILALDVVATFIPAAIDNFAHVPAPAFRSEAQDGYVGTPTTNPVAIAPATAGRTAGKPTVDHQTFTAAIPQLEIPQPEIAPTDDPDIGMLKTGLDALAAGDVASARGARDQLPTDGLDRHILTWAIAMSSEASSAEIASAARTLSQWPGADVLKRNAERALYREKPDPQTVLKAFATSTPLTVQGVTLLARAYIATGQLDSARAVLAPFWRMEKLEASDEVAIIKEFGAVIPTADHRFRMERMLYAERPASAQRVASLAGAKELADAWAAVLRNDKEAKKLLDAVPDAQRSAGYLFAKAKYLRRKKSFTQAAAVMVKAPRDRASLVDPDEWWVERRVLSRELVDQGDIKTAYKLVAAHSAEKTANIVEAEFHAGWYALRGLNDPEIAAKHFQRIAEVAEGPMGLSRAYYWLGRTAEAGGPGDAAAYYKKAAGYGTAFYGQLAATRLGAVTISIDDPAATDADRRTFAGREAVRAIRRLEDAGYPARAEILYRDLAQQLDSPGELALLAAMAEKRGDHFLALRLAKIAGGRGVNIGALSHPVGVIPSSADISGAGMALAYAIARQESEFNIGAVSGAGARGLLQLLPGTAKEMAKRNGLPFSQDRLTTDAGYNATLGAAFLQDQLGRFDGSYVLTFVGYNAGPRRAQEWILKYGDPRGKDLNAVVDWIERIPFTETRNYVQRVMENYEVYKMRLSGHFDIADDLVNGR
ncbi:lytic transglycosylase domain-containing protein [Mesorhizobium sp. BAC0120]|uniref:lytic transglycosylase domain-containing protein n=1 Tax=Mesorhizobium sp. BAC0120 TaxID=3090670 RepID=UPI00298C2F63|nr:lytic transglycosylase domain-containing protein [Mesorhizobium sp. BAC0120]MDW6021191.1 lytic transglycosylase domain-containing protein [Mesorhizobium sp. BAC0120]